MARRLFYVNVALLAITVALGMRLFRLQARESLVARVEPAGDPLVPVAAMVHPVNAASYSDVATRLLFSRDRNPVELVPPRPLVVVPAVVLPPFPKAHGVIMGDNPRIILSVGDAQNIYKAGGKVGEWHIVTFDSARITFQWMGREITKTLAELTDAAPAAVQVAAVPVKETPAKKTCVATPFGESCH